MLKYKSFIKNLEEVLTPPQKKRVDTWEKGSNDFSNHAFKDDHYRQSFELHSPLKSDHETVIDNHLKNHGMQVKDYKKGTALDKHGREVRLGKALEKTKAPEDMKEKFQNDPTRQQKGAENLHVSLSRHPHDVAGMTSRGHSWENESCMNFENGCNRDYLKEDVKHGTHVAYLTHKDDKENEHPLARIALKKYTNVHDPKDHILRPEGRVYGNPPGSFEHTVNKIVEHHFPGKDDAIYKKNENVYHDRGYSYIIGKHAIDKALNDRDYEVREAAANHPNATKEHIDKALNDEDYKVREAAANHPNATKEHLDKASNDRDYEVREAAAKHPNATKEHLDKALNDRDYKVRYAAVNHPNATKEHLDKALNDKEKFVRKSVANHPNATKEHIDKALNDKDYKVREAAANHPNATKEHLDKALNDENPYIRYAAAKHPNATKEHIDKALKDEDSYIRYVAAKHPNATKEHIDKALKDEDSKVREVAAKHPNATKEHLDKASNDEDYKVREAAAKHPNATKEDLKPKIKKEIK